MDHEYLATLAALFLVLACGGVAIWFTFHWYRTLKQPPTTIGEALAQLSRTVQELDDAKPEEVDRIREAIQRQKNQLDP